MGVRTRHVADIDALAGSSSLNRTSLLPCRVAAWSFALAMAAISIGSRQHKKLLAGNAPAPKIGGEQQQRTEGVEELPSHKRYKQDTAASSGTRSRRKRG
jgi:hypothetical protein